MSALFGQGAMDRRLSPQDVKDICEAALADLPLDGKRVLVLIPDHTRHAPIDLFFCVLSDHLLPRVRVLDYLVATGTHTLATGISRPECEAHNLAHRDVRAIDVARWREDPDTLVVEEAGQVLYRLKEPARSVDPT